ncbi:uncharacterized protein [Typha latifolia]|uniref:uncharacterized protein n=1 Tax=Typha latifolia TaxID=4733 RepID=UPI003C2EA947
MADEGNESRNRRMDLNLYLGPPRLPCIRSLDIGSDLALSSPPMTAAGDSRLDSHPPYSPSHSSFTPHLPRVDLNPVPPVDAPLSAEYTPYFPSYEPYSASYPSIEPAIQDDGEPDSLSQQLLRRMNAQVLPTVQEIDESVAQDVESHLASAPPTLSQFVGDSLATDDVAYSPPYITGSTAFLQPYAAPEVNDESAFRFYPSTLMDTGELLGQNGMSSSRQDHFRSTESRLRRLIELRARRFRSSLPYGNERNFSSPSQPTQQQLMQDRVSSQRPSECNRKDKVPIEAIVVEASEAESEEKKNSAASFECNICLDMASEPVVTSCGHLFCWPCLYQWLHIHSDHKECPVCKGEVTESNIVPIYGRGNSETNTKKKIGEDAETGIQIPPRPHGNRLESLRQQGEGIAASLRRLLDHQMRTRFEGHADPTLQEFFSIAHPRFLTRLRARRMQREEVINPDVGSADGDIGLHRNITLNSVRSNTVSLLRDGINPLHQLPLFGISGTERLAVDLGRTTARFASSNNHYGASTSSVNPPNPEQMIGRNIMGAALAADQTSASSTMGVIQGVVAISNNPGEPNSAGPSRSHRRTARSSTSGSFDVDGGALHARKSRRLN